MRRRVDLTAAARLNVPAEISEGPRVSRWARSELLATLEAMPAGSDERREQLQWVKLSAQRRYRVASAAWARDAQITERDARQVARYRSPYFDPPHTPIPRRTGYAAEPAATKRTWHSIHHP